MRSPTPPVVLIDPGLSAAGAPALADSLRWTTYASDPCGWDPEALRYLLAHVAACRLSPEALAALAAASVRLETLTDSIRAMDTAAEALARQLQAMAAAADADA